MAVVFRTRGGVDADTRLVGIQRNAFSRNQAGARDNPYKNGFTTCRRRVVNEHATCCKRWVCCVAGPSTCANRLLSTTPQNLRGNLRADNVVVMYDDVSGIGKLPASRLYSTRAHNPFWERSMEMFVTDVCTVRSAPAPLTAAQYSR